ncbi:MAG TPA: uridine kinase [Terriglobia bacterium]|nr:uridine kinase [Terriglobia bacterium]
MISQKPLSPFIIGIGGGTGSGKSTLAHRLAHQYADLGAAVVDQDSYYRDQSHLHFEQRILTNYDEPAALDYELLQKHFEQLLAGRPIAKPRYCFVTHTRTAETAEILPAPLIIFEGLLALWDERLRAMMDLKIFVEAEADVRLMRRLVRDVHERGRTLDSTVTQYRDSIRPMHRRYVEPTKAYADLVVDTTELTLEGWIASVDRLFIKLRETFGQSQVPSM